ncbi:MAG: dicarboxylate transporter, DctP subunit [Microvirga sp.]|jgi:tripartite ATP-independent transporter DctP family solute receptor|nr:dicarboxylate transporter, DctP subunit [Microvirga sp.]
MRRMIPDSPHFSRRTVLGAAAAIMVTAPSLRLRAQAPISLRFGSVEAQNDNPPYVADDWFCKECTRRSNGALTITHFPAGQIGAQRDLVEGLKLGTVDIVGAATALVSSYVPQMSIFDLPYIFSDKQKLYAFLDGPDGKALMTEGMGRSGLRGLAFYDVGVRDIFNSKRRVQNVGDLKGLKIRVEENPIRVGTFQAMGAQATPMSFTEVYNGIQQGVIDGFENAPVTYLTFKFNEVAKYAAKTGHFITPAVRLMSAAGWKKLPGELQTLVATVAAEAASKERELWAKSEAQVWGDIAKLGTVIDDVDKEGFRKSVQSFVQAETAKLDKEWVAKVMQAAG